MKIGEFSAQFGVTIDTIRYYIELGLIVPDKSNAFYDFDEQCVKDMRFICEYKKLGFTVNDINKLISLKRTLYTNDTRLQEYLSIQLLEKKQAIYSEIEELNKKLALITEKEESYKSSKTKPCRLGVPLEFMNTMACPDCGLPLTFSDILIADSFIQSGKMNCSCGYCADIKDGIIYTPLNETEQSFELEEPRWRDGHIGMAFAPLEGLTDELFTLVYKSYSWLYNKMLANNAANAVPKLIFTSENNSGRYLLYFLLNRKSKIPIDDFAVIIIYVSSEEIIKNMKHLIESFGIRLKVVFILGNTYKLPIQKKSINQFIDDFSSFYYYTKNQHFLLEEQVFQEYLSDTCQTYGFIPNDFLEHVKSSKRPCSSRFLTAFLTNGSIPGLEYERLSLPNKKSKNANMRDFAVPYYFKKTSDTSY